MPFVCTPNEARWNFLIGCRYHTVVGVMSCKPISHMFSVVYCSVNPVYVILQSFGSKGAEVDPSNSLLMPQFQPKIQPLVEMSPLIRWRRDVSWLPNAERHAFGSETERCSRRDIHRTEVYLNEDYCICGNAIISIHQTRHGSSEMGAWLETGGKLALKKISSLYHRLIEIWDQISSTRFERHIIISYHIHESPSIRNHKKTSWHLYPRSPDLKSSTFGTSSRPKIFKASMHVECTSRFFVMFVDV